MRGHDPCERGLPKSKQKPPRVGSSKRGPSCCLALWCVAEVASTFNGNLICIERVERHHDQDVSHVQSCQTRSIISCVHPTAQTTSSVAHRVVWATNHPSWLRDRASGGIMINDAGFELNVCNRSVPARLSVGLNSRFIWSYSPERGRHPESIGWIIRDLPKPRLTMSKIPGHMAPFT